MSANIKGLSLFIDNRLLNLNFQGNKIVYLSGCASDKLTVLYTLERFFARDFDGYYTDIDASLGINYASISGTSVLQYKAGSTSSTGSKMEFYNAQPNIHCIRCVNNERIRSFMLDEVHNNKVIGCNMLEFSSAISDSKWNKLAVLCERVVGYPFVKLDMEKRKVTFDIHNFDSWVEADIKLVYLLLSESMLTPDNYSRATLIPELCFASNDNVYRLIKALSSISRNELIVYCNDSLSFTNKQELKVLTINI